MAKVSLLNGYGEFPLGPEHPSRMYVESARKPYVRRSGSMAESRRRLRQMADAMGTRKLVEFSCHRLKYNTVHSVLAGDTLGLQPKTVQAIDDTYEKWLREGAGE